MKHVKANERLLPECNIGDLEHARTTEVKLRVATYFWPSMAGRSQAIQNFIRSVVEVKGHT